MLAHHLTCTVTTDFIDSLLHPVAHKMLIGYLAAVGVSFQQHFLRLVVIGRNGVLDVITEPELGTTTNADKQTRLHHAP